MTLRRISCPRRRLPGETALLVSAVGDKGPTPFGDRGSPLSVSQPLLEDTMVGGPGVVIVPGCQPNPVQGPCPWAAGNASGKPGLRWRLWAAWAAVGALPVRVATMSWRRLTPVLPKIILRWSRTVCTEMNSAVAMSSVDSPSITSCATSRSRQVSLQARMSSGARSSAGAASRVTA
jgi:hypothetical protein